MRFFAAATLGLVAAVLAGCTPAPASLAAGPMVAQAAAGIPPLPAGLARVWFLRQFEPSESLRTPMMFANGAPFTTSVPGTAFFRDYPPGTYSFAVETCTVDFNQTATLNLTPGSEIYLEIQSLQSLTAWGCLIPETFYVRAIPPERARLYFSQLTYLGNR